MSIRDAVVRLLPQSARRRLRGIVDGAKRRLAESKRRRGRPDVYRLDTGERVGAVFLAETHLSAAERLFMYAIVRGARPKRALEIGSALGGSASIVCAAMEDVGGGKLVGIDPIRRVDPSHPRFFGRFRLIEAAAPDGVEEARRLAGGPFDFVFYDGPNVCDEVGRIMRVVVPLLAPQAYVVFDNGLHYGVHEAVRRLIEDDPRLHDCGFVCRTVQTHDPHAAYNGLRLVRFDPAAVGDPQPWIDEAYRAASSTPPTLDPDALNHDVWWCAKVRPCARCARDGVGK